jgi:hypothetical protein
MILEKLRRSEQFQIGAALSACAGALGLLERLATDFKSEAAIGGGIFLRLRQI